MLNFGDSWSLDDDAGGTLCGKTVEGGDGSVSVEARGEWAVG